MPGGTCDSTAGSRECFTCFEALSKLPNGKRALHLFKPQGDQHSRSFVKYLAECQTEFDSDVLPLLKVKLNIVKFSSRGKPILVYDNRYASYVKPSWPKVCWIFDEKERLVKSGDFSICIPFSAADSTTVKNLPPEQDLWELFQPHIEGGGKKFRNPKNVAEAKKIVCKYGLEKKTIFWYHWKILNVNKRFGQAWLVPPQNEFVEIDVEAFLKPDYTLGFRGSTKYLDDLYPCAKAKKLKKIEIPPPPPPDEFQRNCSSSISVDPGGLNRLFNLSALSSAKFENLSTRLGKTCGILWIELDSEREARFATFRDSANDVCRQFELSSQEKWKKLFDCILLSRENMNREKRDILGPALDYLKTVTENEVKSPFSKCLWELEACVSNYKVLVYGKEDFVLHALKTQFSYYMYQRKPKGFRGVALNTDAKNNLSVLKTSEVTIFNFSAFRELDDDDDNDDGGETVIFGPKKLLRYHPPRQNNQSILSFVSRRGIAQSGKLQVAWQELGGLFLGQFQFDIHSIGVFSLSHLSYTAIWTLYTRRGGWFHHGLEKTKAFDLEVLRSQCRGGFAFSSRLKREANEPLRGDGPELCKNIQACDVRSSYGFACSQLSSVKGFCQSFKWNGSEESDNLILCDKVARQRTFEFQSVFYTVHFLETKMRVKIKTVYSNFHQFGIFNVKNYPVDLVVVTEEGHLRLFQFDGIYAHGCRSGCPDLKSYVHNKSRWELEKETKARDLFLESWCRRMNASMDNNLFCTYRVETSCHDSPYFKSNLAKYFESPENSAALRHLTSGYFCSGEITKDQLLFCSDDLTFLAVVEGYTPRPRRQGQQHQNPLLIRSEDDPRGIGWERSDKTPAGGLFLTRDYLKWLVSRHNFQVTRIRKAWVYKRCRLFNDIFRHLIDQRAALSDDSSDSGKKEFYKRVVNYCSGYFGLNEAKSGAKVTHRICVKLNKRFDVSTTEVKQLDSVGNVNFILLSQTGAGCKKKTSNSPLPIYCLITEFGKMTLSKVMCHFEAFLSREKFMFVYSNVDNLVLILAADKIEEAVADPSLLSKFLTCQEQMFGSKPGQLKREFEFVSSDNWKFVTSMTQNYALLADDSPRNVHKNNGWNAVSSEESYKHCCDLLDRKLVQIRQERRIDKILNSKSAEKIFSYRS